MYRVVAIIVGALALAACSSTPEWLSLDALKPAPSVDTVRFESEPPGAEAKVSNGQTCRTPCALALPVDQPLTVVFTLNGYQQDSETIDPVAQTGGPAELKPNPVIAQLTPLPPPIKKKSTRKPVAKKKPAPKAAAKPAAQPAAAPPPMTTAPAQQAPAPWPAAPKQ